MVHKALGAEYSASAIIETYFCLPNVTDFNLGLKTFLFFWGGGGGGASPQNPLGFLFFTVPQFPPLVDKSYGQGT